MSLAQILEQFRSIGERGAIESYTFSETALQIGFAAREPKRKQQAFPGMSFQVGNGCFPQSVSPEKSSVQIDAQRRKARAARESNRRQVTFFICSRDRR